MENHEFRAILIKLQDRLSDNDRKRLHFFFGNDVPRRIRDDPSLGGTLSLMESLFDQDKINDQDFTFLIRAFDEILCHDAAKLLREHMKHLQSSGACPPLQSLQTVMPIMTEHLSEPQEEDRVASRNSSFVQNIAGDQNTIVENKTTNINPLTVVIDEPKLVVCEKSHVQCLNPSSNTLKCLLFLCCLCLILLLLALLILSGDRSARIHQFRADLLVRDQKIEELLIQTNQSNEKVANMENDKANALVRVGRRFGGNGGDPFDDSYLENFTQSHYLCGMIVRKHHFPTDWVQFLYASPHSPNHLIKSEMIGTREETDKEQQFLLDKTEKILRVHVKVENVSLYIGGILKSVPLVRAIRLFTTTGRSSPGILGEGGQIFTEEFDGYTLGYARGRKALLIDQLQFSWYRTLSAT